MGVFRRFVYYGMGVRERVREIHRQREREIVY